MLMQSQLRWVGHVVRMKDHRLPKKQLWANYLKASAFKEAGKSASKTHLRSPGYLAVSTLIVWNIWRRTGISDMKLSNVERKSVKTEETQQLSCAENLEKTLPHQSLLPTFLVLTAQDSLVYRLISLAICAFTNTFLNHKVDQIVLIDYDGQRRGYVSFY